MRPDKLVAMANQVASFFRSYPGDEAAAGVHRHLEAFWTPGMVQTLERHLAEAPPGVDPLVMRAMQGGPPADNPAQKVFSPARQGAMASDAG